MLYATASVASAVANQGVVGLTFEHMLSKVHFTVTSNAQGGYSHTVTGIKVSNFSQGTYTIATDKWAGTAADIEFHRFDVLLLHLILVSLVPHVLIEYMYSYAQREDPAKPHSIPCPGLLFATLQTTMLRRH
jgi:hypothetical protein